MSRSAVPTRVLAAAGFGLLLAGTLAWFGSPDTTPAAPQPVSAAPRPVPAAPAHRGHDHEEDGPAEDLVPTGGVSPDELKRLTEEAIANGDDLSDGLDLPPPARSDGPVVRRPEQPEPTRTEILEDKMGSVETLERTVARLEADLAEVLEAGDEVQAERLELRLERTRERLENRRVAVEQMRQEDAR